MKISPFQYICPRAIVIDNQWNASACVNWLCLYPSGYPLVLSEIRAMWLSSIIQGGNTNAIIYWDVEWVHLFSF